MQLLRWCRTHATIAAYSTGVPTLVVGYSVKARGIARDLFGTEDGYVLPVQQLKESDELTKHSFACMKSAMPSGRTSTRRFPAISPEPTRHARHWRNFCFFSISIQK